MLNYIARKLSMVQVAANSDEVVTAFDIPAGGSLNQIHLRMSIVGNTGEVLSTSKAVMYGISGYMLPVPDPDASLSYETAWDQLVPKDQPYATDLDLDTAAADTSPEFEPGEIDTNAIFNMVGLGPREFFRRRRLLTFADLGPIVGAAAIDTWNPGETFRTTIN
ncbi:MAG TPA: hypothetical protein EYN66_22455, partial [Myxococcales bacterium]|nr:hypothetical protein [Myxococcales bacterium]